jgi:hypothetical protein
MDITSFILGITFVVVVGMLTVTVYNLLRVQKISRQVNDNKEISYKLHDSYNHSMDEYTNYNNEQWSEHHRSLDSRLDKLIYRIERLERQCLGKSNEKQLLND